MITERHKELAYEMGKRHAEAEKALDVLFPTEPLEDEEDVRTLFWKITGEKVSEKHYGEIDEPDSLAASYEDGYWEVWNAD